MSAVTRCFGVVVVLSGLAGAAPALADVRQDVHDRSDRCDGIADDRRWLDCYYGAAQPMRARLGLSPAPQTQQQALPAPVEHNGIVGDILGKPEMADIVATVSSLGFEGDGRFTVTLSNGQVWHQSPSDAGRARWPNAGRGMVATISPGAFGTFNLRMKGENGVFKVKQER